MATPFIVVYEDYFDDCDAAEAFVHTKLAEAGLRLSDSREFFRAPVSDVVKTIAAIPSSLSTQPSGPDELLTPDGPEFADFVLEDYRATQPWDALMEEADKHYFGWENYLEDRAEALRIYRDAARLGSPMAFERIGDMYLDGSSVLEDSRKALEFYKEGAKKGNYFCYAGMTTIFLHNGHFENARKALHRMIDGGQADRWKTYIDYPDRHISSIASILISSSIFQDGIDSEMISIVQEYFPKVVDSLRATMRKGIDKDPRVKQYIIQLVSVLEAWVNGHPAPPPKLP